MEKQTRPKILAGKTTRVELGCGKLYVTICIKEDNLPFEVFATMGKAGGCSKAQLEALTRSITLGLRCGIPADEYVRELKMIKCPSGIISEGVQWESCADAIAQLLSEYIVEQK